jgi:hypothetical protein
MSRARIAIGTEIHSTIQLSDRTDAVKSVCLTRVASAVATFALLVSCSGVSSDWFPQQNVGVPNGIRTRVLALKGLGGMWFL